ncbi:hypothetical protein MYX76_09515 [Desulfobacterota bacterium AH_259_B03_O07]|nr:hypothetical protein [Desulfobacterota bacterium AH_259_B03_O07]
MAFSRLLAVIVVLSFLFGCTTFRTPTNVLQKRPPADQILFPQGEEKDELLLYNEIAQYIYIHSYYFSEDDKESFEALRECFVENAGREDLVIPKNLSKENYILRELCFHKMILN